MSNKKVTPKAKEAVKIRFKKLANGNKSIYLDLYKDGKREYEFLKMYVVPEKMPIDKETNAQTLALANAIKSKRIVELQNNVHGFSNNGTRSNVNVIDYIKTLAEKKCIKSAGGDRAIRETYFTLAKHIELYSGTKTNFKQINKAYCTGFIEYLKTAKNRNFKGSDKPVHENTAVQYMKRFEIIINAAISDEIINSNPFKQIKPENKPKKQKSEILYLTIDEIKLLENTPFSYIKQFFLFSCYTGLRLSDVRDLTWEKLQKDNNGDTFINYIQKKTKKQEYLPIPQKAINFLPERNSNTKDTDKVFYLPSSGYINMQLKMLATIAGLKKHLTFHVARHTYATLLLTLETPIEVVSKNLGHADIQTTQIYAKVVNAAQRAAVDKLDGLTD